MNFASSLGGSRNPSGCCRDEIFFQQSEKKKDFWFQITLFFFFFPNLSAVQSWKVNATRIKFLLMPTHGHTLKSLPNLPPSPSSREIFVFNETKHKTTRGFVQARRKWWCPTIRAEWRSFRPRILGRVPILAEVAMEPALRSSSVVVSVVVVTLVSVKFIWTTDPVSNNSTQLTLGFIPSLPLLVGSFHPPTILLLILSAIL